jgi:Uma2 family endonuclease
MRVTEEEYRRIAVEDPDGKWELDCGELRSKPPMTFPHNQLAWMVGHSIQSQLDMDEYVVRVDAGRIQRSPSQYYIPDVMVIPTALAEPLRDDFETLESYDAPLPLVVEVWSRSTARFDLRTKLPFYQQRGDQEIWFLHPVERMLTSWRRQPAGGYTETRYRGGAIQPAALPGVTINLDTLFR